MKKCFIILGFVALSLMAVSLFVASSAQAAVTIKGAVTNIAPNHDAFSLRTAQGNYQIMILPTTKITDSNGVITVADLNNGMKVSVTGTMSASVMQAEAITTTTTLFTGTITGYRIQPLDDLTNAATFDLSNTSGRTFVLVPRGAKLLDSNGAIKLEDLNNGMTVSIKGSGTTLQLIRAETITTTTKLFTGMINGYNITPPDDPFNAASFELSNTSGRTFVLVPRGAKLLDSNGAIKLEDLNNGMTVSIKGSGTMLQFIRAEAITKQ